MRPLSDRGRAQVDFLARAAGSRGAKPDVIWHSGKLRARQTAEAYWRCCNPLASFSAVRGLQPTDPTGWILDAITGETRSIMLAGHFPHMPRLLGRLISGDPEAAPSSFPLNGIVVVDWENERWVEKWRLSPS